MKHPHEVHWKESKIILQYVQGTKSFRVHYAAISSLELVGFSYSDWDGDPNDRKYTSCFVFMLADFSIFWSIKKQQTISLSSAVLGYRADLGFIPFTSHQQKTHNVGPFRNNLQVGCSLTRNNYGVLQNQVSASKRRILLYL